MEAMWCYEWEGGWKASLKVKEIESVSERHWFGEEIDDYRMMYYFVYWTRSGRCFRSEKKTIPKENCTQTNEELEDWLEEQLRYEVEEVFDLRGRK